MTSSSYTTTTLFGRRGSCFMPNTSFLLRDGVSPGVRCEGAFKKLDIVGRICLFSHYKSYLVIFACLVFAKIDSLIIDYLGGPCLGWGYRTCNLM
ncbi:hypothetical protein M407DRAFT_162029 [Tulasnella calospora MUT 4182]|uniref:Uncharacterized protein n=1 Tax=Tulasnella calospora MUT 4182 TaxID=1051891 RepID=A0A0C3Q4G0_9AGAM|nr:hypothetical protein M407DRAFT_162029 [Tulasnella calospora MUT 4182]